MGHQIITRGEEEMIKVKLTATLILVSVLVLAGMALGANEYTSQEFLDNRDVYRDIMNEYFRGELNRKEVRDKLKELNGQLENHLIDLLNERINSNDSVQVSKGEAYVEAVKAHSSAVLATAMAYQATDGLDLSLLKAAYELMNFVKQNPDW